jgi:GntR family transcriptional regulator, histidine utilization repressor
MNGWCHAPFSTGDIVLSAANASKREAELLACAPGTALFIVERTTWAADQAITAVRLCHAPGYRMRSTL